MSVHTLPNIKLAEKVIKRVKKIESISDTHPFMKNKLVRDAIFSLLDDNPKTGDDILRILYLARGELARVLKILEDVSMVEELGIRSSVIAKAESLSSFLNEIIYRDLPATFLCNVSDQRLRARAYSLWLGLERYINIIGNDIYSVYTVNVAYLSLSLHKLGLTPDDILKDNPLSIRGEKFTLQHHSFLSMAKYCSDIVKDGIKAHKIKPDIDIRKVLMEIEAIGSDSESKVVSRHDNTIHVNFKK